MASPDVYSARLLEQIQHDSNERHYFYSSSLVEAGWSEALGIALLEKLKQDGRACRILRLLNSEDFIATNLTTADLMSGRKCMYLIENKGLGERIGTSDPRVPNWRAPRPAHVFSIR